MRLFDEQGMNLQRALALLGILKPYSEALGVASL